MSTTMRGSAVGPAVIVVAMLAAAACANPPTPATSPRATASAARSSPSPSALAAPGPTNVGTFDAVHAAQILGPSVGLIIANGRGSSTAEGSGFVFSSQGTTSYVLTNNHVVEGATRLQVVMPDGRHFVASLQGTDPLEDVAVVKVGDSLPVAQLADSTRVQVGQPVVAIGSPLGSQGFGTVTVGVISALHRTLNDVGGGAGRTPENLADVLQTDAPINPGNSGGPLADGNGRVIGMNTAGSTNASGIGFAIPSRVIQRIAQSLMAGRTPGHPYLGICYQPVESAIASDPSIRGFGVVVQRVLAGTPAEAAGIRGGDVIQTVDGTDLNNGQTLGGVLQLHNPGDIVRMTAVRDAGHADLSVTLGDRPASGPGC